MENVRACSTLFVLLLLVTTDESKGQSQQDAIMTITTNSTTVVEGGDFMFQCVTQENVDEVNVVVDGVLEGVGGKFDRIQPNGNVSNVTEFTFQNVNSTDQATRLQCYATYAKENNKPPISSKVLLFNVGYAPTYGTVTTVFYTYNGTDSDKSYTLPLDSNPYPVDFKWSYNGTVISNPAKRNIFLSANSITFGIVLIADNGSYSVNATNLVGSGNAAFELIVYYGPNFVEGNNVTKWVEFEEGVNTNLLCSMSGSNPSNVTLSYTNTSSLWANVDVGINDTNITISFTNSTSANSGFYNCSASSDVATTTLSYWVFFGDAPSGVKICPMFGIQAGNLVMNLTITDNSMAPASALTVNAIGLLDDEVNIIFTQPVLPMEAVIIPSVVVVPNKTVPSMFTIEVNVENKLSTLTGVYSSNFSYTPPPNVACSFPANLTTRVSYISASAAQVVTDTSSIPVNISSSPANMSSISASMSTTASASLGTSVPTPAFNPSSSFTAHDVSSGSTTSPSASAQASTSSGVVKAVVITVCILVLILLVFVAIVVVYCFWKKRKNKPTLPSDYSELVEEL